jgi:uncharacterized membrane protein
MAFYEEDYFDQRSVIISNIMIEVIFIVDLCFAFVTAYQHEKGIEYRINMIIKHNVLNILFLVDLLACLPIDLILALAGQLQEQQDGVEVDENTRFVRFARLPRFY